MALRLKKQKDVQKSDIHKQKHKNSTEEKKKLKPSASQHPATTPVPQKEQREVPFIMLHCCIQSCVAYLGGPEAEGCRLDISFLFVHQQQRFVFYQTQILSCGYMPQSERLTPADMTPTPPGYKHNRGIIYKYI